MKVTFLASCLCLFSFGCKARDYASNAQESSVSETTTAQPSTSDDALYRELSARYNPYSTKQSIVGEWALAEIVTMAGHYNVNPPAFVIFKKVDSKYALVKDQLPTVTSSSLVELGIPKNVADQLLKDLK
jgi:hypothetical protein